MDLLAHFEAAWHQRTATRFHFEMSEPELRAHLEEEHRGLAGGEDPALTHWDQHSGDAQLHSHPDIERHFLGHGPTGDSFAYEPHKGPIDPVFGAVRPGRGEKTCLCCQGKGEHGDGSECDPCDGSGYLHSNEPDRRCPGQPQPRRRHWRERTAGVEDYGVNHRPPEDGAPLHDMTGGAMPPDIYENLHQYDVGNYQGYSGTEHMRQIMRTRGRPDAKVRIWRAAPALNPESRNHKRGEFNTGDWIGLDKRKAQREADDANFDAEGNEVPVNHPQRYHIWNTVVRAEHVRSAENDLTEWGYWGPHREAFPHNHETCNHRGPQVREASIKMAAIPEYGPKPEHDWDHLMKTEGPEHHQLWEKWHDEDDRWKSHIQRGLSLGHLSGQQAKKLKFYFDGHQTDSYGEPTWQKLPDKLYHVTTDLAGVRRHGLKTRDELSQIHGGHGLGMGPSDMISLTSDEETGRHILRAMHEFHDVVKGRYTPQQMWDEAKEGRGAPRPFHRDLASYWDHNWKDGDPLPGGLHQALHAEKHSFGMGMTGTREEIAAEHGPQWEPTDEGWDAPRGHMHVSWKRPMTEDERRDNAASFYKTFAAMRQHAGGHLDPLFIGTDTKAFAAKDPHNFAMLHVRPAPGAQGYPASSLAEWRTGTGDALKVHHYERWGERNVHEAGIRYSHTEDEPGRHTFDAHDEETGQNVGYATAEEGGPREAFIDEVYVHPKYRGHGLARQLMTNALDHFPGRTVNLRPEPYEKPDATERGPDERRLRLFYQTFGFEDDPHFEDQMVRRQASLQVVKAYAWAPGLIRAMADWYHGSTNPEEFDRFDFSRMQDRHLEELEEKAKRPEDYSEHYDPRWWNSRLGSHFTMEHDAAAEMAKNGNDEGNVYHVDLDLKNPKHYDSEHDLAKDAYAWARRFRTAFPELKGYDSPMHAAEQLRHHPKAQTIANGFRTSLRKLGHDGIIYGNEYEGTKGHKSAIIFRPEQAKITEIHNPYEECSETGRCPHCQSLQDKDNRDCENCGEHMKIASLRKKADREFVHQGDSPLDYSSSTYLIPKRMATVDPEAGEHPKGDLYFAETSSKSMRGPTGRRLKNPRTIVHPGAEPGTVSFADYSHRPGQLYIHYMKTRRDQQGQGLGSDLVSHLIDQHPDAQSVDFGRMLHPAIGAIKKQMEEKYPDRRFYGHVWWGTTAHKTAVFDFEATPFQPDPQDHELEAHMRQFHNYPGYMGFGPIEEERREHEWRHDPGVGPEPRGMNRHQHELPTNYVGERWPEHAVPGAEPWHQRPTDTTKGRDYAQRLIGDEDWDERLPEWKPRPPNPRTSAAIPNGQLKLFHMTHERPGREPITVYRGLHLGLGTAEEAEELHRHPLEHLDKGSAGIHWTDDLDSAWNFAHNRGANGWAHEPLSDEDEDEGRVHELGLILHGEVHPDHIVRPHSKEWEDYSMGAGIFEPEHPERETTIRGEAPVRITHVTSTSMDAQSGQDRERTVPYGRTHLAAVDKNLPFMRQPSEEELAEHLERRHGMDREQQVLYDFPGHWNRWHEAEHHYLTRNDHQHAEPHGHPLEEKYPAAHVIPDDANDVMGVSGGHSTRPWQNVRKTGPFYPTDLTHYSARGTRFMTMDELKALPTSVGAGTLGDWMPKIRDWENRVSPGYLDNLRSSMQEHGQLEPAVIRNGWFDEGHHRAIVAEDLGWPGLHVRTAAWTPHERIFGPTFGLDHRLFEDDKLRPEVRQAVVDRMNQVLPRGWPEYVTLYLAGSEASEWTSPDLEGNSDFDVLADLGPGSKLTPEEFNKLMRSSFNDENWHPEFGGTWHLTGYCNGRPITEIQPYAAWDITHMKWVVKPPHLPEHSAADFPPALLAEARALASQLRSILKLDEPLRTRQARALWQYIHDMRSQAFSPEGSGWQDPGNVIEKYLDQHPHHLLDKLRGLVFAKTAAAEPQLDVRDFEGTWGNRDHITRSERGMLPVDAIAHLHGVQGERPGEHRNRQGDKWEAFKADIAKNGIQDPIFITVDPWEDPKISEGNHRRDAAVELGHTHAPVEIRYFGHAEREGSVHERWRPIRRKAVLPGGDLSSMHDARNVEWVRTDKLMPHREWYHGPGVSVDPEGREYAPRHTPQEWADMAADVKAHGIREPIHLTWDPKSNYAYVTEGNSRLQWAHEAGHEAVPVTGHRNSWIPDRPQYKLPGPSKGPQVREQSGMNHIPADLRPSSFLPESYMYRQEKMAAKIPLYHGSIHEFSPGTVLTPEDRDPEGSIFSGEHVYATTSPEAARYFGSLHDTSPQTDSDVYVHRVEPVGEVEPDDFPVAAENERFARGNYRAKALRVIDSRRVPGHFASRTASGSGDRYVTCDQGHEHWGAYGAAGLLIRHQSEQDGKTRYLMQRRAPWVQHGNTWSTPGGALHRDETPQQGAMRETREELGSLPRNLTHHHTVTDDHGGWAYHTVVMDSPEHFNPRGGGETEHETAGTGWFSHDEMSDLPLHPGFAKTWDTVRRSRTDKTAAQEKPTKTKEQVNYRKGTAKEHCGNCVMIRLMPPDFESHSCTLVKGLIEEDMTCDEWYPEGKKMAVFRREDLPPKQRSIFEDYEHPHEESYRTWSQRFLDVAKTAEPGTHVWRGERRPVGEDPAKVENVGMHWTTDPDMVIKGAAEPGQTHVVWQGQVDHPDQHFPRSHPMWYGVHRSLDVEGEIRFRPGAQVRMHGAYVWKRKEPEDWEFSGKGPVPSHPERNDPNWEWHPFPEGHTKEIRHRGHGAADYSELGIPREASVRNIPSRDGPDGISKSMMVAIVPPAEVLDHLQEIMKPLKHDTEPRSKMHVTLLYLGQEDDHPASHLEKLPDLVHQWAKGQKPFDATAQGSGTFANDGNHVLHALVDIPGGHEVHGSLVDFLKGHGLSAIPQNHGWIPHITLAYSPRPVRFLPKVDKMTWPVSEVWYCHGGRWESIPLGRSYAHVG